MGKTVEIQLPDEELEQENTADLDVDEQLGEIFEAVGEDLHTIKIKVYKVDKGQFQWIFDEVPAGVAGIDQELRDRYGAGLYELRVLVNGKIQRRLKVPIGRSLADRFPHAKPDGGLKADEILGMVREMQQNQMEQFKLMLDSMRATIEQSKPPAEPPADPFAMQNNLMSMMIQMKEFLKPETPTATPENPITLLKDVMGLTEEVRAMSGDAGPGALLANVAKDTLPGLLQLAKIEAQKKQGLPMTPANTTPPQTPTATPDPAANQGLMERYNMPTAPFQPVAAADPNAYPGKQYPMNPTPPATPTTNEENPEMLQKLFVSKSLERLVPMARNNRRPEVYAEVLLDMAEDYHCEQWAVNFICSETFIDEIAAVDQSVLTLRPWFEQLRAAVIEMTTPEGDGLTAPPAQANVSSNVDVEQQESIAGDTGRGDGYAGNPAHHVEDGAPLQEEPTHT